MATAFLMSTLEGLVSLVLFLLIAFPAVWLIADSTSTEETMPHFERTVFEVRPSVSRPGPLSPDSDALWQSKEEAVDDAVNTLRSALESSDGHSPFRFTIQVTPSLVSAGELAAHERS